MGTGDDNGNLMAWEGRRRWRLSGWGLETMLETQRFKDYIARSNPGNCFSWNNSNNYFSNRKYASAFAQIF